MAETQNITHVQVNGTVYSVGGDNTEAAFTLTENNGAQMSAYTSTGEYAVAEGVGTIASGPFSHAEGYYTSATTYCEHASGQYNVSLSGSTTFGDSGNTLFTVGNGYVTGSTVTTHNADRMRYPSCAMI